MSEEKLALNSTYAEQYQGLARWKFWLKVYRGYTLAYFRLFFTLLFKRCYYGPFKGEFGHFLAHNLPFLYYLHQKGVKIHYCGMDLHEPLLKNESGELIVADFVRLRDFFVEVTPNGNVTRAPEDVKVEMDAFQKRAKKSWIPYWDISDDFFYWFVLRQWMMKGPYMRTLPFQKIWAKEKENSVVVFPRNKKAFHDKNNGAPWDYDELVDAIKPYFDKVYVVGHPAMSDELQSRDNVEVCIASDNSIVLEKCAQSKLIITQHSGTVYLSEYCHTDVLIIFKGEKPIGSIQNTILFQSFLGNKFPFSYAYNMEEVLTFVKNFNQ